MIVKKLIMKSKTPYQQVKVWLCVTGRWTGSAHAKNRASFISTIPTPDMFDCKWVRSMKNDSNTQWYFWLLTCSPLLHTHTPSHTPAYTPLKVFIHGSAPADIDIINGLGLWVSANCFPYAFPSLRRAPLAKHFPHPLSWLIPNPYPGSPQPLTFNILYEVLVHPFRRMLWEERETGKKSNRKFCALCYGPVSKIYAIT